MANREFMKKLVMSIPATVDSAQIRRVLRKFMATYAAGDIETRVSLFADQLSFEDPAGLRVASSKAELRAFWNALVPRRLSIHWFCERIIVIGNEALLVGRILMKEGDEDPVLLLVYAHFVFDKAGAITQLRSFFDEDCVVEAENLT